MQDSEAHKAFESSQEKILVDDDFSPLSGKPYFHTIVKKSCLKPLCHMVFVVRLHKDLPSKLVPATVTCQGKTWEMMFLGDSKAKRLDAAGWRQFVTENNLKVGDALFWEVMESSEEKVELKVQIIKGDFPVELEERLEGKTEDNPIVID